MIGKLGRETKCRGCGAEICFIKTVKGKSIPVDPEPVSFVPGGGPNTYVIITGEVKRGRETEHGDENVTTWLGYRSHFANCPAADEFRKKQKSERVRR